MSNKIINGYEIKPNAMLAGANLYGANLKDADLQGANLKDADLESAKIFGHVIGKKQENE